MGGLYKDETDWRKAIDAGDPLVYRVDAAPVLDAYGQLLFSITTIEPGAIGSEFFMTKGHWHTEPVGEFYLGLSGQGLLLLFDGQEHLSLELAPGTAGYIPPGWAHRTVNPRTEPFRFLAVYPGGAGHDYERVVREGMGARVVRGGTTYHIEVGLGPRSMTSENDGAAPPTK
jgi:glucose-6-phosphate isomerase